MFGLTSVEWVGVALLTPFWWAMGLFVLALLGDIWPPMGVRVSHLFDELKRV
jgi:hypothetical protein